MSFSPAAQRNKAPILAVLNKVFAPLLAADAQVLEIASGTGQHLECFSQALPGLQWLPSEQQPEDVAELGRRLADLPNVSAPLCIDARHTWPLLQVDAVLVANLFHIAPCSVVDGFFAGACHSMRQPKSPVVHVYGPFKQSGAFSSERDRQFDRSLRERNSDWGIRDLEWVP